MTALIFEKTESSERAELLLQKRREEREESRRERRESRADLASRCYVIRIGY